MGFLGTNDLLPPLVGPGRYRVHARGQPFPFLLHEKVELAFLGLHLGDVEVLSPRLVARDRVPSGERGGILTPASALPPSSPFSASSESMLSTAV